MQQYLQLLHAVRVHTPNVWPPAPIPNFEHWLPCERLPNKNTFKHTSSSWPNVNQCRQRRRRRGVETVKLKQISRFSIYLKLFALIEVDTTFNSSRIHTSR